MQDKQIFAILPTRDAEWLQARLAKEGIEVASVYNQQTCTSGCSPSKEVWVHPQDVDSIQRIIVGDRLKTLEDLGADVRLLNQVFDDTKTHATCPACGFSFETKNLSCPDCGLSFGS